MNKKINDYINLYTLSENKLSENKLNTLPI
jgi:hypothetical protein